MKRTYRQRTVLHTVLIVFLICPLLRLFFPYLGLTCIVCPSVVLFWCVSVRRRIVSERIGTVLTEIAALMILLFFLENLKNCVSPMPDTAARYLWYAGYIPMTALPLLCFRAAWMIGQTDREINVPHRIILAVSELILSAGFLTNDLHGLAFRFYDGIARWEEHYRYGVLYVLSFVWITVLLSAAFLAAIRKSSLSVQPHEILIPLTAPAVSIAGFFLLPLSENDLWQIPELFCFMIIGFLEGLIDIGLVPSNEKAGYYFNRSHLSARITDREGRTVYISDMAVPAGSDARTATLSGEKTVLHRQSIRGGEVFWEEDRGELQRLEQELLDVNERLAGESDLLKAENRLKEEQTQISEKNRIYDEIGRAVVQQTDEISRLVRAAKTDDSVFAEKMEKASFLTVYIKRKANLALHAVNSGMLNTEELIMSIRESLEYLGKCGAACMCTGNCSLMLPAEDILTAYDAFEAAAEAGLPSLSGMMVRVGTDEHGFYVSMTLETPQNVPELSPEGFSVRSLPEDDCVYITLTRETEDSVC